MEACFQSMSKFVVLHTDPKLHPLDSVQRGLLEDLGATVMLLEDGSEDFAALAPLADAVLNADFPLTAAAIATLRRCRVISRFGTGVDNIDVAAATAHRIPVANVPEFCTGEVANRTWTLALACACQSYNSIAVFAMAAGARRDSRRRCRSKGRRLDLSASGGSRALWRKEPGLST